MTSIVVMVAPASSSRAFIFSMSAFGAPCIWSVVVCRFSWFCGRYFDSFILLALCRIG